MPWIVPSSPKRPCSALKTTSGFSSASFCGDVALHVDARDAKADALQRCGARLAGTQRHFALDRPSAHQDRDVCTPFRACGPPLTGCSPVVHADSLDLPFELDAGMAPGPGAGTSSPRVLDVGSPSPSPRIDEKIAVHLAHHRAADAKAATAGGIDQPSRRCRPADSECRAARFSRIGCAFSRCSCTAAMRARLLRRLAARSAKHARSVKMTSVGASGLAIREAHLLVLNADELAVAPHAGREVEHVFRLAAVRAGVHAQRAADRARNAEDRTPCRRCPLPRPLPRRACRAPPRPPRSSLRHFADLAEAARRKPNDHAPHAAIAHDQI